MTRDDDDDVEVGGAASLRGPTRREGTPEARTPEMGTPTLDLKAELVRSTLGWGGLVIASTAALVVLATPNATSGLITAIGVGMLVLLLAAIALAMMCARSAASDVEGLTAHIEQLAQANPYAPISVRTSDELAELARSLEKLRARFVATLDGDRSARARSEDADRDKTEFLRSVSHELRTPLNSILGFSQVLLAEIEGPLTSSQREDLEMIHSSGEHLLTLFNDVLDFSALASGHLSLRRQDVDVRELLLACARLVEAQCAKKPVTVRTSFAPEATRVSADPVRLQQIVMNFGSNAAKFTERGAIHLRASVRNGRELVVSVSDTGPGIALSELDRIFEEYAQVEGKRRRQGVGLGLAIAKRLTELHGGHVEVQSTVGEGSEFRAVIPLGGAA